MPTKMSLVLFRPSISPAMLPRPPAPPESAAAAMASPLDWLLSGGIRRAVDLFYRLERGERAFVVRIQFRLRRSRCALRSAESRGRANARVVRKQKG